MNEENLEAAFGGWIEGNTTLSWLAAVAVALAITLMIRFASGSIGRGLQNFARRHSAKWDDVLVDMFRGLRTWVVFVWVFYPLLNLLDPPESVRDVAHVILVASTVFQIGSWGFRAIRGWRDLVLNRRMTEQTSSAASLGLLYLFVQTALVILLTLVGLSHLGIDIRALLTGLGIGGIAVALAAQNILGDLFASLSIAFDKPFVVGDFIVMGEEMGTVEHIGVKTTRVRSLSGEELVFSNKDLLESRIRNYKRMRERRVVQKFGVVYETPLEKLKKIPDILKSAINRHTELRFDRCHFFQYGVSSLDFELVFFVLSADYNQFMDLQQDVLHEVFDVFRSEQIEFAYPTQKLFVNWPQEFMNTQSRREGGPHHAELTNSSPSA